MLPVYENTKEALGFDPDAEGWDTELPAELYPSGLQQFIDMITQEAPHAVIIIGPANDDAAGSGEVVPGAQGDGADLGETGAPDTGTDTGPNTV